MKVVAFCAACIVCWASGVQAADLLSGTWTAGNGPDARVYIFKVSGDRITGIVCGPCDDPASVFRIEDGRIAWCRSGRLLYSLRRGRTGVSALRTLSRTCRSDRLHVTAEAVGAARGRSWRRHHVGVAHARGRELRVESRAVTAGTRKLTASRIASHRGTLGVGWTHGSAELDPQGQRQPGLGTRVRAVHTRGRDNDRRGPDRRRHDHVLHQPYRHAAGRRPARHPTQRDVRKDLGIPKRQRDAVHMGSRRLLHSGRRDRDDRTDQGTLNSPGTGGVTRRSVGGISCGIHPYGIR